MVCFNMTFRKLFTLISILLLVINFVGLFLQNKEHEMIENTKVHKINLEVGDRKKKINLLDRFTINEINQQEILKINRILPSLIVS